MLYDRQYMRPEPNARSQNLIFGLIIFNVVMYAIQLMLGSGYTDLFSLQSHAQGGTRIWSFLTYSFLHDPRHMTHILANMIGVFFLGRALLPELGEKRFMQLYLGTAITGGLLWYIVSLFTGVPGMVVGASGAVFGLIAFFGLLYGENDIYFMMVIRMKAKVLMYLSLGIAAFGLVFGELLGNTNMAHSAHLGGMLGGYLYFRFVYQRDPVGGRGDTFKMPHWFKPKPKKKATSQSFKYTVNINPPTRDLKKEVDLILDKINSKGFGSLSPREKQILDEAGDLLKKR